MLPVLTSQQISHADRFTIENDGVTSLELMDRAAQEAYHRISDLFPHISDVLVLCGNGNNGGDGLVIARLFHEKNTPVRVFLADPSGKRSEENAYNLDKLKSSGVSILGGGVQKLSVGPDTLVIDALFGIGLKRAPEGAFLSLIRFINGQNCHKIAIDIPSGLMSEGEETIESRVFKADYTLTFQVPKFNLLQPDFAAYTGKLEVLDIGLNKEFIGWRHTRFHYVEKSDVEKIIRQRHPGNSKHDLGHALLIAGNGDKNGAAILAVKACLRSGAGLTTIHVPRSCGTVINIAAPEAMLSLDADEKNITTLPKFEYKTALGLGPGLGTGENTARIVLDLLQSDLPKVVDADALNVLAQNPYAMSFLNANTILTPHAREFDRLTKAHGSWAERIASAQEFVRLYSCILVLKAPHTMIFSPKGKVFINSSGNAGLAKGGTGDVLTGIITAYLAQGIDPLDAAIAGVYHHGLAADLAVKEISERALLAGDVIEFLGKID